jgi:hypothetical protein
MPDHQGRQDFPEVADEKINIGNFKEWSPLGQADIYSPKEEPKLRDQVMLDQEQMLKELCTLIESFNGKKADKKVEDPYKGSSIKKAAGWTMDKQNPEVQGEGFGNDAYYKPPSKKELSTGHASMRGEKSEWDTHGKPKKSGVNKQKSEKSGFEMCAKCGDKGNGIEKGGVCKACVSKSVVKSIDNYLR